MKKIFILLLITLMLFLSFKQTKANDEVPNDEITTETVNLLYQNRVTMSNPTFDLGLYTSTGYVTLNMGYGTNYTINLDGFEELFNYYTLNKDSVSRLYLKFNLGDYYTGVATENQQWLSNNVNWDVESKEIDVNANLESISLQLWWNVKGTSGGAPSTGYPGGLRLYGIDLVVEYAEPVSTAILIESIDGKPNWNQIPETSSNPIDKNPGGYGSAEFFFVSKDEVTGEHYYDLRIEYNQEVYIAKSIALPFMYSDYAKGYYYTFDDGDGLDRYVWFFGSISGEILTTPNIQASNIIWNLTDEEYKLVERKTVHGKPYATGNGITTYNMLYLDLIVPWEIDDMMSITLDYDYRFQYAISLGSSKFGKWHEVRGQTYLRDVKQSSSSPWWTQYSLSGGMILFDLLRSDPNSIFGGTFADSEIEDITETANDSLYKRNYVNYMQEYGKEDVDYTIESVFPEDFKAYKIFLGQFEKWGSNAVQAKDIVIVQMTVVSDDIPFTVFYPEQDISIQPDPSVPSLHLDANKFWNDAWSVFKNLWYIGFTVAAFLVYKFIAMPLLDEIYKKNKSIRKPSTRFIILAAIWLAIFFIFKI